MASKAIGFLNFKFGADLSGFERAMNKAQKKLKKFGKNIQKTGQNLTMGLTLPIVGLGVASLKAFDEQEKAIAQVEAGLKSTGNMVGFTSKQLQKMAADLQKTTLFGDEEILKGATAQLLTFTNIAGEQFARTQKVALDLATRLDGDLKSSSIMLGKALNDPIANLSALSRAGIQFSSEQKETIKALVETNRLADAQSIILAELEKQYGGSAEAAAKAGSGPIKQLQNELSDLSEQIGARLLPFVQQFVTWIKELAEKFDGLTETQKDNIVKWGLILAAIGPVLIIIGKMSVGIGALIGAFKGLAKFLVANPYIVFAAAITGVVFAIGNWIEKAWGVSEAQRSINEVMDAANKAILTQQTEVNILTGVLKNENSTLKDKEIALNKLKEIAPDYYGKLNAAKLDVVALDTATKNYTESIQKQALAEAGRAKLVDLSKELIDLQSKQKEVNKFTETLSKLGTEEYNLGILNLASEKSSESRISSIKQEIDEITNLVVANEQLSNSQKKVDDGSGISGIFDKFKKQYAFPTTTPTTTTPTTTTPTTTTPTTTTTTTGGVEKKVEQMEALSLATHDTFEEINLLSHRLDDLAMPENLFNTDPMDKYRGSLGMLGDQIATFIGTDIKSMEEAMASYADQIGNNLAQGAESFQEYGNTVKGIMKEVIGAMISAGVAAAVRTALESIPPFPGAVFLIPILAGAAAGLARTAFNSLIPEFADGGLVTGPTTALIGEGSGTSMANPEVVAPLDKLKSMMGGGSQNIIVEGVLRGNDIYLSNKNTSVNRLRTT